jgi:hypothetical protein
MHRLLDAEPVSGPQPPTVAALYVERGGVYWDLPAVDPWDEERDARLYAGPWPVVAHPACARWSRLAGFTEARYGLKRGDDGGCFSAALDAVKTYGGVLEHPAYSAAWDAYGLPKPKTRGGWTLSLLDGGASCYVEQGRYGLPVKKATWLYAYGVALPDLKWGYTPDHEGSDSGGMDDWRHRVSYEVASSTPPEFRDELIAIARSAGQLKTLRGAR